MSLAAAAFGSSVRGSRGQRVTMTFEGVVVGGVDQLGLFGEAGADLTGLPYAAAVQYEVPAGPSAIRYAPLAVLSNAILGRPDPVQTHILAIGDGAPVTLPALDHSDGAAVLYIVAHGGTLGELQTMTHGDDGSQVYFFAKGRNPEKVGSALHLSVNTAETYGGRVLLPGMDEGAAITLQAQTASATPVGAAQTLPEPPSWAASDRQPGLAYALGARRRRVVA